MNEELQKKLEIMKFQPTDMGAMIVYVEDVKIIAVTHPWKGLVLIASQVGAREATLFEVSVPEDSSLQQIAKALSEIYDQVHPKQGGSVHK